MTQPTGYRTTEKGAASGLEQLGSARVLFSIAACAALMAATLLLAPIVAGQLVIERGYTNKMVGFLVSAELAGLSLASLPAVYWLPRLPWTPILVGSLALVALGNAVSIFVINPYWFATLRFATALCAGNVMVLTMVTAASSSRPERSYSWWLIGQQVFGVFGFLLLPRMFSGVGLTGFYFAMAAVSLCLILTSKALPKRAPVVVDTLTTETSGKSSRTMGLGALSLVALLGFNICVGGIWTYIELAGLAIDVSRNQVSLALAIGSVVAIIGALLSSLTAEGWGRRLALFLAAVLLVSACLPLAWTSRILIFCSAIALFKFMWNFSLPLLLSSVAAFDKKGGLVALSSTIIGAGLSVGPSVAAFLIGEADNFSRMFLLLGCVGLLSIGLAIFVTRPAHLAAGTMQAEGRSF